MEIEIQTHPGLANLGDGSDHTFIDQDVKMAASPYFAALGIGLAPTVSVHVDTTVNASHEIMRISGTPIAATGTIAAFVANGTAANGNMQLTFENDAGDTTFFIQSRSGLAGTLASCCIFRQVEGYNMFFDTPINNWRMSIEGATGHVKIGNALVLGLARLDVDNQAVAIPIFMARDNGTEVFRVADGGDTYWTSDGTGLLFGGFYGNELADVTLGTAFAGGFVIISDAGIAGGEVNNTTFQNNQELLIAVAGRYLISYSVAVEAGNAQHIITAIGINGTAQASGKCHVVMPAGAAECCVSSSAILDLAATNTITVMIDNESGNATPANDVTIEHISLSLIQIGGT